MDFYEANSQQECDMINKFIKHVEIAHCMAYACVCVCVVRTNNSLKNGKHQYEPGPVQMIEIFFLVLLLLLFKLK